MKLRSVLALVVISLIGVAFLKPPVLTTRAQAARTQQRLVTRRRTRPHRAKSIFLTIPCATGSILRFCL